MVDPQVPGIKNNSVGDNLVVPEVEAGVEDARTTPVFLDPRGIKHINDNYLLGPTLAKKLVQKSKRVVQRPVQTVNLKLKFKTKSKQESIFSKSNCPECILSCCQSCSFCLFPRATTKERYKSLCKSDRNKRCQKYFLCKSMSFCPSCSKCPQC